MLFKLSELNVLEKKIYFKCDDMYTKAVQSRIMNYKPFDSIYGKENSNRIKYITL